MAPIHDELPIHTTLVIVKCPNDGPPRHASAIHDAQHDLHDVHDAQQAHDVTPLFFQAHDDVPRPHALVTHDRQPTNDDPLQVLNGETYDEHPHAHNYGSRISNPVFYLLSLKEAL